MRRRRRLRRFRTSRSTRRTRLRRDRRDRSGRTWKTPRPRRATVPDRRPRPRGRGRTSRTLPPTTRLQSRRSPLPIALLRPQRRPTRTGRCPSGRSTPATTGSRRKPTGTPRPPRAKPTTIAGRRRTDRRSGLPPASSDRSCGERFTVSSKRSLPTLWFSERGAACNRIRLAYRLRLVDAAVVVFEANDVVFDAQAHLRLDEDEVLVAVVLNAVHVADVDEAGVAFGYADVLAVAVEDAFSLHHHPVFFAVLVLLEREALARVDDDALHAVAGLVQVLFPAAPGAVVGIEKHRGACELSRGMSKRNGVR